MNKKNLKSLSKRPYLIQRAGLRGTIVTIPANYLALTGMQVGDQIYLYIDGDDLVISKNQYL